MTDDEKDSKIVPFVRKGTDIDAQHEEKMQGLKERNETIEARRKAEKVLKYINDVEHPEPRF